MAAYYNENDKFAVAWLRELIKAGLIADGEVDDRSIKLIQPADLRGFCQCHFFAGIGGWSYALRLAGWPDTRECWTGSCPCQPFSVAGKGEGTDDSRHLWPAWKQLIEKRLPPTTFGEQVASADGKLWLDLVCDEMEQMGYAFGAAVLPAASVGADHARHRIFFAAQMDDTDSQGLEGVYETCGRVDMQSTARTLWGHWSTEPAMDRVAYGVPARVGRLRGYGNAIVPQVAQVFIEAYLAGRED